ncbi:DUF892 family protein [Candidatus Parcubacteria bacterium]|nr:DUF892 family protein [Candidatus Parcubacteria bacterium]
MNREPLTLRELLVMKLQALYDIEKQIVEALPKMIERAHHQGLKAALREHLAETRNHVCRIEDSFKLLREKPHMLPAKAIRALIEDGEWVMANVHGEHPLDAALIASAQYIEHYEMAGYSVASSWAEMLGEHEVAELLSNTLAEEEAADDMLSDIADGISEKAADEVLAAVAG